MAPLGSFNIAGLTAVGCTARISQAEQTESREQGGRSLVLPFCAACGLPPLRSSSETASVCCRSISDRNWRILSAVVRGPMRKPECALVPPEVRSGNTDILHVCPARLLTFATSSPRYTVPSHLMSVCARCDHPGTIFFLRDLHRGQRPAQPRNSPSWKLISGPGAEIPSELGVLFELTQFRRESAIEVTWFRPRVLTAAKSGMRGKRSVLNERIQFGIPSHRKRAAVDRTHRRRIARETP